MANVIKVKRSAVAGKVPVTGDLQLGELAINTYDGKLYLKKDNGTESIVTVNPSAGAGDVVGPASATDNAIARYDGTTGKLIQNSLITIDDDGDLANINSLGFDTTPTAAPTTEGTVFWDDGDGVPSAILKGALTTLQIGTQEYARVYNDSGSTLTRGQVVYISGAQGNRVAVKLARADVEATSFGTIGFAAETIANGAEGYIIVSGALYKLNTTGLTAGAAVYLSPTTAGAYTTTKPQAPDQLVILGWIERISATVGSIYVKIDNGYELDELHDVVITTPSSGNTLIYDATASVWKNASLTQGTGITVTNGAGSITIANSAPMTYPGAGIPNSTGSAWGTSLTAPAGSIVGTTDTQTLSNKTLTGTQETVFTITDGAAFEVNPANGGIQQVTLGANRTPKATSFAAGQSVTLMVNDGTAFTLTWTDTTWGTGGVIWVGGVAPTLATAGFTVIEFWKVSTQVYGALVGSVA